jgi:hypothetical protein
MVLIEVMFALHALRSPYHPFRSFPPVAPHSMPNEYGGER